MEQGRQSDETRDRPASDQVDTTPSPDQFAFVTQSELVARSYSGPIPTGDVLKGIDDVVPGAAAEIVRQGNANVQADRENEQRFVRAVTTLDIRGQWMAYSLTIAFGIASLTLFLLGITAGGITLGIGALAPIVRSFLDRGTNVRKPPSTE